MNDLRTVIFNITQQCYLISDAIHRNKRVAFKPDVQEIINTLDVIIVVILYMTWQAEQDPKFVG